MKRRELREAVGFIQRHLTASVAPRKTPAERFAYLQIANQSLHDLTAALERGDEVIEAR